MPKGTRHELVADEVTGYRCTGNFRADYRLRMFAACRRILALCEVVSVHVVHDASHSICLKESAPTSGERTGAQLFVPKWEARGILGEFPAAMRTVLK